ncbi:MAG TPA: ABC transporter permease [Thermoplasmata archaeon]|jgi:peptide/nickel transport system permease protein|nr:ABC transporter permease [Thermoplasmata archaeon]
MRLRDYIIRRVLLLIPVLIGVSIITFALTRLVGGPYGAASIYINERCLASEDCINAVIHKYGFDQPIPIQYLKYMEGLFHGDLGYSKAAKLSVTDAIATKLPATFELAAISMIIAVVFAIPMGVLSATRRNKPVDHATRVLSLSGVSVPVFWLGLMLKYVLYYFPFLYIGIKFLPIDGRSTSGMYGDCGQAAFTVCSSSHLYTVDSILALNGTALWDAIAHLLMPAVTLAFVTMAVIVRMMRSSMLEVLNQEYIKTARSKGLSEKVVIKKHARRNALIPTTTVIGLSFGGLLGGAVLTETIFSWPGIGRWSADAVRQLDPAAIMGFTLVAGVVYVVANLVVDVLYAYLDPRIRLGE